MSRLDQLPPDQRAALSVLLRGRKTYAEVAGMLGISERAVHDRAHAALAVLAPGPARELDPALRNEIGDYLLGQQAGVAERLRTRTLLSSSLSASRWAQALAAELRAEGELPEIPPPPASAPAAAAPRPGGGAPYSLAEAASSPSLWEPPSPPSSRLGGALVLAAILAAAVVVVILVFSGGSSMKTSTSTSTGTSASAKTEPKQEAHFPLKAPGKSASTGTVEILSEGTKHAFYIQAEHIPATNGFFYAVWLYNSPTSALPLSKSPPVGKSHKLAGAALLPENAGEYHEILLTRETSNHPTHPGHVVLRGPFSLKG